MAVSEIQIVATENIEEVKSAKDIQSVVVTLKEKERSKNDAIETVKPIEINTKEPPKSGRNEWRNERFLFKQVATRG